LAIIRRLRFFSVRAAGFDDSDRSFPLRYHPGTKENVQRIIGEDLCPRWENNKGEKGPWGKIVKAIIP
jgi:hypothetical protein